MGNHLAGNAAGGISRDQQNIETPICCAAVARSAANRALDEVSGTGQEYPQPAKERREEGKRVAGMGQRQARVDDSPE